MAGAAVSPQLGPRHLSSGEPPGRPGRSPRLMPHPHDWMVRSSHSFHGNSCLHASGRQEDTAVTTDHSYGHPGTRGGGPKEQDEGDDGPGRLCGLLSGEIQTAFQTLPLHSAECSGGATLRGCHALGVPHSGGLGSDIHLTNTSAPLWKTLVRPWAHGRLRSCHVRQQPGGRWILMGHFTALR